MTTHGFLNILAHSIPSVALREDVFRQALGAIAAVLLLRHFKHQFFHGVKLRRKFSDRKRGLAGFDTNCTNFHELKKSIREIREIRV